MRFKSNLLVGLLLVGISFSGCSAFKKGSGEGGSLSESDLNNSRDARFGEGSIPTAEGDGMFRDIHFDFDSTNIDDIGQQNIDFNVQVLKSNPDIKVQLEGHCDERGTGEYNLALGESRSKAVKQLLISYGIPESSISTISYGEEVPLEQGHDEMAWSKNRRVHFSPFN